jgi:tetratricopeptide (TPR) repeat protein
MPGEAMSMVARLRAAGEDSVELDLIQGRALLAQGMPEEALHVLEQVAKDMPTDPRPHRALGVAYTDLQRFDEAVAQLEKAVSLAPNDAATLNNLGFLELSLGQCTSAVEHLEHVIALDGTSSRYRNNLAFALVCVGEAQRALSLFRSTGFEADARYNMGVAYERLDKLPPAIAQYQAALEADAEHKRAQDALARLQAPLTSPGTEIQP